MPGARQAEHRPPGPAGPGGFFMGSSSTHELERANATLFGR